MWTSKSSLFISVALLLCRFEMAVTKLHASLRFFVPFTCKQPTAEWAPAARFFCENVPDKAELCAAS